MLFLVIRSNTPIPHWWPAGVPFRSGNSLVEDRNIPDWKAAGLIIVDSFLKQYNVQIRGNVVANIEERFPAGIPIIPPHSPSPPAQSILPTPLTSLAQPYLPAPRAQPVRTIVTRSQTRLQLQQAQQPPQPQQQPQPTIRRNRVKPASQPPVVQQHAAPASPPHTPNQAPVPPHTSTHARKHRLLPLNLPMLMPESDATASNTAATSSSSVSCQPSRKRFRSDDQVEHSPKERKVSDDLFSD